MECWDPLHIADSYFAIALICGENGRYYKEALMLGVPSDPRMLPRKRLEGLYFNWRVMGYVVADGSFQAHRGPHLNE